MAKNDANLIDAESEQRFAETLKRVLATPPDHKTKPGASLKRRGRPPKAKAPDSSV
jgi:hypothetical protein